MERIYHQGRKELLRRIARDPEREYNALFYLNVKRDCKLADFPDEQEFFDKLKKDSSMVFSGLRDFFEERARRYALLSECVLARMIGRDVMKIANDERIREGYEVLEGVVGKSGWRK